MKGVSPQKTPDKSKEDIVSPRRVSRGKRAAEKQKESSKELKKQKSSPKNDAKQTVHPVNALRLSLPRGKEDQAVLERPENFVPSHVITPAGSLMVYLSGQTGNKNQQKRATDVKTQTQEAMAKVYTLIKKIKPELDFGCIIDITILVGNSNDGPRVLSVIHQLFESVGQLKGNRLFPCTFTVVSGVQLEPGILVELKCVACFK